jgi:hypothetical protein
VNPPQEEEVKEEVVKKEKVEENVPKVRREREREREERDRHTTSWSHSLVGSPLRAATSPFKHCSQLSVLLLLAFLLQISKSQRKKMKKRQKLADQGYSSASQYSASTGAPSDPLDPDEVVRSKLDPPHGLAGEGSGSDSSNEGSATARKKLRYCDNCGAEILTRVQACAGCKKVAYCNFRCQKASWKVHKKTCSYALRKDGKESTG